MLENDIVMILHRDGKFDRANIRSCNRIYRADEITIRDPRSTLSLQFENITEIRLIVEKNLRIDINKNKIFVEYIRARALLFFNLLFNIHIQKILVFQITLHCRNLAFVKEEI